MRVKEVQMDIDYNETKQFFKKRADKFREDNPYSVTMYQDNNQELVQGRNKKEVEKLLPFLNITEDSKILDIACGIGRWADALPENVKEYCGVDFSDELIAIANSRNTKQDFSFLVGATTDIEQVLIENNKGHYDRILMIGILMYLNDDDVLSSLEQIERICDEHAIICIREPIGIQERLTLKDFFSEELDDYYNAIYRRREELIKFMEDTFMKKGFHITQDGFLFDEDTLNNRKETAQYYYILER